MDHLTLRIASALVLTGALTGTATTPMKTQDPAQAPGIVPAGFGEAVDRDIVRVRAATAPFTSGGASFPAGTVLFDDTTAGVIGPAAQAAGLTLRLVATAPAQLEDVDRSPRIAVFTNAVDQSVWSLRNLGFTADPVGTTALNGASDPLVSYDVIFSTANYP